MGNKGNKKFKPNKLMIYYWVAYALPEVKPEITDACRKALELLENDGVTDLPSLDAYRQYTYRWKKRKGYTKWKEEFWSELMNDNEQFLDKVGVMKSLSDFRYWEGMQMKYHKYRRGEDVTSDGKTIKSIKVNFVGNTDELRTGNDSNKDTGKDTNSRTEGKENNNS